MPNDPKYVIECQHCQGSLTIIYDGKGEDPNTQMSENDIMEHLKTLLQTHYSLPEPHSHQYAVPKNWATKVRKL